MPEIRLSIEAPRGCGYRKPGGIYLVTGAARWAPCGKLPFPLHVCPTCSGGIKPSRGWTWIDPSKLFAGRACQPPVTCKAECPLHTSPGSDTTSPHEPADRAGLLWIGEQFYPTPLEWMTEAVSMGVSRRIKSVPRGFELGKHWIYVAHRKVWLSADEQAPAIFQVFCPSAIEYVVKGDETEEELAALEKRGLSLVRVQRKVEAA